MLIMQWPEARWLPRKVPHQSWEPSSPPRKAHTRTWKPQSTVDLAASHCLGKNYPQFKCLPCRARTKTVWVSFCSSTLARSSTSIPSMALGRWGSEHVQTHKHTHTHTQESSDKLVHSETLYVGCGIKSGTLLKRCFYLLGFSIHGSLDWSLLYDWS